jgi:di/tricarboxylate transporter
MTVEIGLVLAMVAGALLLFASQRLPLDVAALALMTTLMMVPLLGQPLVEAVPWLAAQDIDLPSAFPTVEEGLSGLSSPATVTVLAMFVLSSGVQRSGLMHALGRSIMPFVGSSELRLFLVVMPMVGVVSGLVNNTAAVAVSIPFVLDMSRQIGAQASRLLMPLSFFGMLGGMLTLVGTSTNILASTIVAGMPEFGRELRMFEFTAVGAIVLVTGLVYFLLVGRRLLPARGLGEPGPDEGGDDGAQERFVVEVAVAAGSAWAEAALEESGRAAAAGVEVLAVVRDGKPHRDEPTRVRLEAGDVLQVRGTVRQVADLVASEEVTVLAGSDTAQPATGEGHLVRALVRNRLLYSGRRASEIGFWPRYRARLLGVEAERTTATRLADERLRVGEILLLEAGESSLPALRRHPDLVLLSEFEDEFDRRRMWLAGGTMLAAVLAAALTPLPIVVTALLGIVVMVVTGCVVKEDLYSGVAWDVIFMLAGVIPLGIAMTKSGGADWLGDVLASGTAGWHPLLVLVALYVVTTLLTEVVSNNASVVILVPVAASLALELGVDLLPLVLTIMFAASTSFLSPVGYQTNAMVYGTGLYRFTDFARVGAPLNLLLSVVTPTAIWFLWIL